MLPLGGEVIESLPQKECESYTLHLIFHTNNIDSRNTTVGGEKRKYTMFSAFLFIV